MSETTEDGLTDELLLEGFEHWATNEEAQRTKRVTPKGVLKLVALACKSVQLQAQLTEVTRERDDARAQIPTGRPDSDRLLLNAYGRECYEAGQQSALAPLRAVVEAAKGLVGKDGARPGNLRVPHVGPRTQEVPEAAWVALRDAIAAFPADPAAPAPAKE